MSFVEKDGGFLIEDKVIFGATVPHEWYINLWLEQGEAMLYTKLPYTLIDYPGEYDIGDIFVKVFSDKAGKLNYFVSYGNATFAVVQSPRALDEDEIAESETIYYTDDSVGKMLDKLEIEAKREKLLSASIA